MNILFVSTADYKYGAPKAMMELMGELNKKEDVNILLLTKRHSPLNDWCREQGIENYFFWYRDIMAGSAYHFWGLNCAKHAVKYICYIVGAITQKQVEGLGVDFNKIDIIHSNMGRIDIGAYIARKYSKIHIWHLRELESGHARIVKYRRGCIDYMNRHAQAFVAISNTVQKNWVRAGIREHKIKVIYDGIDTDGIAVRHMLKDSLMKIVMVGRLEEHKGQLQIIQALRYIPEEVLSHISVDIIGDGYREYKKKIIHEVKKYGYEEIVCMKGYEQDINKLLSNYDIGINCSKGEAFGRITVEYMAAGLVAVVSDTGANTEIINDMENGLVYEYGNAKDLADKLVYLYQQEGKRKQIAQEGYRSALTYSKAKNAEEVYRLYQEVLAEKNDEKADNHNSMLQQ